MKYRRGDEVVLKIEQSFGYRDQVFASAKILVIGYNNDCEGDDAEYLCYVPPYESVPYSFVIQGRHLRRYGALEKYFNDTACVITNKTPIFTHVQAMKGATCTRCKEFIAHAENQEDYRCRACRDNPYR